MRAGGQAAGLGGGSQRTSAKTSCSKQKHWSICAPSGDDGSWIMSHLTRLCIMAKIGHKHNAAQYAERRINNGVFGGTRLANWTTLHAARV